MTQAPQDKPQPREACTALLDELAELDAMARGAVTPEDRREVATRALLAVTQLAMVTAGNRAPRINHVLLAMNKLGIALGELDLGKTDPMLKPPQGKKVRGRQSPLTRQMGDQVVVNAIEYIQERDSLGYREAAKVLANEADPEHQHGNQLAKKLRDIYVRRTQASPKSEVALKKGRVQTDAEYERALSLIRQLIAEASPG